MSSRAASSYRRMRLVGSPLAALRRALLGARALGHNGIDLGAYPEDQWNFVPFPAQKGPPYVADNLATVNNHSFLHEPRFAAAYEAASSRWSLGTRDIRWRLHTLLWAAQTALSTHPDGALIELGTGNGFMAAGACSWLDWGSSPLTVDRELWLVDSFAPTRPDEDESTTARRFYYADGDVEVRGYFARYQGVHILKGWLPGAVGRIDARTVAFVHVDLNDAGAEIESLEALRPRFRPGTIVLFDDSGNPGCEEQFAAHMAWAAQRKAAFLLLPSGQGLSIVP